MTTKIAAFSLDELVKDLQLALEHVKSQRVDLGASHGWLTTLDWWKPRLRVHEAQLLCSEGDVESRASNRFQSRFSLVQNGCTASRC